MSKRTDPLAAALGLSADQTLAPFPKPRGPAPVLSEPLVAAGLSLRAATAGDLAFLIELYLKIRAHEFLLAPWTRAEREALMRDQFRLQHRQLLQDHPAADYWVVDRSEAGAPPRPIGRYYLDRTRPIWRGVDIGFLPEERRHGYGAGLLEWTKAEIRGVGAAGMNFMVAVDNPRAHALYERLGYRDVGEVILHHRTMEWRPEPE